MTDHIGKTWSHRFSVTYADPSYSETRARLVLHEIFALFLAIHERSGRFFSLGDSYNEAAQRRLQPSSDRLDDVGNSFEVVGGGSEVDLTGGFCDPAPSHAPQALTLFLCSEDPFYPAPHLVDRLAPVFDLLPCRPVRRGPTSLSRQCARYRSWRGHNHQNGCHDRHRLQRPCRVTLLRML